jgi:hypothetical protein
MIIMKQILTRKGPTPIPEKVDFWIFRHLTQAASNTNFFWRNRFLRGRFTRKANCDLPGFILFKML